jgi:hypothetical protein
VSYQAHLWSTARRSAWEAILREPNKSIATAVGIVVLVMGLALSLAGDSSLGTGLWCALAGLAAMLLAYAAFFLAHLLYLTPRDLLAEKQNQLHEERARLSHALADLDSHLARESGDRVTATLARLVPLLKARNFTDPVAGLYEAGIAELEPHELDDLCARLVTQQLPHPFAGLPGESDYWIWLLQTAIERGIRLRTQKDLADYHTAVQLENTPIEELPAPAAARRQMAKA